MMKYNPFHDAGIASYEQFKLYPFLVFGVLEIIKNRIQQQIKQIKDNYHFGDRLIILGERGIGKTSSLFFIEDMLKGAEVRTEIFSRLIMDTNHLEELIRGASLKSKFSRFEDNPQYTSLIKSEPFYKTSEKPIYILIDFPDTIDAKSFKAFLSFLWSLLTHKNYNKINLIFTMNKSHYEKSFSYSEILGKFLTLRLERLDREETKKLIDSRLKLVNSNLESNFNTEVLKLIFDYSKGIPRNTISACSLLVDTNTNKMTKEIAENILKEKYTDQIIYDRTEDLELKSIYRQMVNILKDNFNGTANSKEGYIRKVMDVTSLGRNSVVARINDLIKFGVFTQYKGGYNRVNKIISLS